MYISSYHARNFLQQVKMIRISTQFPHTLRDLQLHKPGPVYLKLYDRNNMSMTCACTTVLNCVAGGEWGQWGSWSNCSALCNGGRRERRRTCENDFIEECIGVAAQEISCNTFICPQTGEKLCVLRSRKISLPELSH